jgi:arylsulfatase
VRREANGIDDGIDIEEQGAGGIAEAAADEIGEVFMNRANGNSLNQRKGEHAMARGTNQTEMRKAGVMRVAGIMLAAMLFAACNQSASAADRPNILILLADDLGYSDIGCYGGEIRTPHLDQLAAKGLRFTQFYNTGRCWPTRASILTGYYAQAVRHDALTGYKLPQDYGSTGPSGDRPRWAPLLPKYLQPLGYRSTMSGKWHVDGDPMDHGFDHAFLTEGTNDYFDCKGHTDDGEELPARDKEGGYYSTVAIADFAIKHLREHAERHADQPFFQYVAFHAPHFPVQALPEDIAIYKDRYKAGWDALRRERLTRMNEMGIADCALSPLEPEVIPNWNPAEAELKRQIGPDEVGHAVPWESLTPGEREFQAVKMAIHAAMVHRIDIEIGRVLDQIEAMGALDNTIVFFMSDNGASAEQLIRGNGHDPAAPAGSARTYLSIGPGWSSAANTPFRLHKSWNHEGGIRTPLIVSWPAGIAARGELRATPGHVIDLTPTVLDLAGGKAPATVAGLPAPPMHGISLAPAFAADGSAKRDDLWWNHHGNRAIRVGDWKLVADHDAPWELFDLSRDPSEIHNLAAEHPEKVNELEARWTKRAEELHALALQDPPSKRTGNGK